MSQCRNVGKTLVYVYKRSKNNDFVKNSGLVSPSDPSQPSRSVPFAVLQKAETVKLPETSALLPALHLTLNMQCTLRREVWDPRTYAWDKEIDPSLSTVLSNPQLDMSSRPRSACHEAAPLEAPLVQICRDLRGLGFRKSYPEYIVHFTKRVFSVFEHNGQAWNAGTGLLSSLLI